MTDERRQRNERRTRGPAAVAAAFAAALVGGGCADAAGRPDVAVGPEVGEFSASQDYLAGVAEGTDGLAYRMSMDMTVTGSDGIDIFDVGATIMTGEVDGDLSLISMDMAEMYAAASDELPGGNPADPLLDADLTVEMVSDGTTGYVRAPYFAALADVARENGATSAELGPLADIAALGDEWATIDLTRLSPSQVASASGGQTSDPRVFLDLMAAGTDVRELGNETIDGVETRGLGATITFTDLAELQGMDEDDIRQDIVPGGAEITSEESETVDEMVDAMLAMEIPIEAWIDGDDRVRSIVVEMNMTAVIEEVAEAAGEDEGDGGMSMTMAMDFTDYGDETIAIQIPTAGTDITDEFVALLESDALYTAGAPTPASS